MSTRNKYNSESAHGRQKAVRILKGEEVDRKREKYKDTHTEKDREREKYFQLVDVAVDSKRTKGRRREREKEGRIISSRPDNIFRGGGGGWQCRDASLPESRRDGKGKEREGERRETREREALDQ